MFGNPFSPYWWMPQLPVMPQPAIRRVDIGGIYELSTNAVQLTDVSVDYGINPACYNALPCESIVLLKVHADAPAGGESLPIALAIPNNGQSTVSSNDNPVTGSDVTGSTERLAYINKRTGTIRFLEFTSGTTTASTPSAEQVVSKSSK